MTDPTTTSRTNPPYPSGNLNEWAVRLYEYLIEQANADNSAPDPSPVALEHQLGSPAPKAIVDGVLMYDPAQNAVVVSIGGQWKRVTTA